MGGRRAGYLTALGAALANTTIAIACGLGLSLLVRVWPGSLNAVKFGGALFLSWLGITSLFRAFRYADGGIQLSLDANDATSRVDAGAYLGDGLAINLLSPVIISYYLSVVPTFIPVAASRFYYPGLAATHVGLALACHSMWATGLDAMRRWFVAPWTRRTLQAATGLALIGLAFRIVAGGSMPVEARSHQGNQASSGAARQGPPLEWPVPTRVVARPPSSVSQPAPDSSAVESFLHDAAHYPGGRAGGVVRPGSLEEVSACLRSTEAILPVGAQSSLTGGATPLGGLVLSTDRLASMSVTPDRARVGAGVPLQALQDELVKSGRWFPPVPTYLGAFAGGAVATCAAGAATFKYGTVREWVEGLTVVLAGGDVLSLSRGEYVAGDDGVFEIVTSVGVRTMQIPSIRMPDVPKRSAGYFLAPRMDLVDLFIGSEGTLGVIVEASLRTAPQPGGICRALVPVPTEDAAISLTGELRAAAQHTWRTGDPLGIDVAAIEHLDARSIQIVRDDGIDRKLDVALPSGTGVVLLIDLELSPEASAADLWSQLENAREGSTADAPLVRFCRLLDANGVLDDTEIALPKDRARSAAFAELREAVPAGVNRRVALAKQQDAAISKTAADMIVPFDRFAEMMRECRRLFAERDLDLAVWGHISDGNVHPNVIPRSARDVEKGRVAIVELGRAVIAMGGCPLAEHGVGRNPIKQHLLRQLYGDEGVRAMRAVKRSLDPNGSLAMGVIFRS